MAKGGEQAPGIAQLPQNPKLLLQQQPDIPRAARWIAGRWVPPGTPDLVTRGAPGVPPSLQETNEHAGQTPRSSGFRSLRPEDWLEVDATRFAYDHRLKKALLLDKRYRHHVYQAAQDAETQAAQHEVLDLVVEQLRRYHSDTHRVTGEGAGRIVELLLTGDVYRLKDWEHDPHVLASLLTQEDMVLLRQSGKLGTHAEDPVGKVVADGAEGLDRLVFAGGVNCFTFTGVDALDRMPIRIARVKAHGQSGGPFLVGDPMHNIHKPVAGFKYTGFHHKIAAAMTSIAAAAPVFRSNWNVTQKALMSPFEPEITGVGEPEITARIQGRTQVRDVEELKSIRGTTQPADMFLKVEYQTFRRLPKSGYLYWTLHLYVDPLPSLARVPACADMLARTVRALSPLHRRYRDLDNGTVDRVCAYLDGLVSAAGYAPGSTPAPRL